MAPPLLSLENISLRFSERPLFSGLSLDIRPGERIALIGRNGMGKSSLMKLIAGEILPEQGSRFVKPGVLPVYLAQEPDLARFTSVRTALEDAARGAAIEPVLAELDLDGDAAPAALSGGELRRVALARAFLAEPDLLLADEPTNHLDLLAIDWLERRLAAFSGALILVSHDRRLLRRVSTATWWLDRGRLHRNDKGFADYDRWQAALTSAEQADIQREKTHLQQELHWLARGVTARRKRNQGRLRALDELRAHKRERITAPGSAALKLAHDGGAGKMVIEAEHISKAYGDRVVVRDFSTRIIRGERIGIVGANGAGKTTLLHMLTARLAPDHGTLRLGPTVKMLFIDQKRAELTADLTIRDFLSAGGDYVDVRGVKTHIASYLKDFLFEPAQAMAPVSSLSGGERARLLLAHAFAQPGNLVVLDEPTNDLDMDTLDLLEEVLADFDGTVILVSHDRDFLDRLVTSTIVLDGDGGVEEYVGGFSDWERATGGLNRRKLAKPAAKPKSASPAPARAVKAKLSYKDQRALEILPGEIAALAAEIAGIEAALADPMLYARDRAQFDRLMQDIEARRALRALKEDAWLELELKREAL